MSRSPASSFLGPPSFLSEVLSSTHSSPLLLPGELPDPFAIFEHCRRKKPKSHSKTRQKEESGRDPLGFCPTRKKVEKVKHFWKGTAISLPFVFYKVRLERGVEGSREVVEMWDLAGKSPLAWSRFEERPKEESVQGERVCW